MVIGGGGLSAVPNRPRPCGGPEVSLMMRDPEPLLELLYCGTDHRPAARHLRHVTSLRFTESKACRPVHESKPKA